MDCLKQSQNCAGKTISEAQCSHIYEFLLSWYLHKQNLVILLLGFPSFIILKQKRAVLYGRIVLLRNYTKLLCSIIWYHCCNSLLSGLKVQTAANRKGWYTLLLESPSLLNLKQKMAVFMQGVFRFATETSAR